MNKKQQARLDSLLPKGKPKNVRIYDNGGVDAGGSLDCYTVIFSGLWKGKPVGYTQLLSMNACPTHPQMGIGMHCEYQGEVDRPSYGHLGKKISFDDLPAECQKVVLEDYKDIWQL